MTSTPAAKAASDPFVVATELRRGLAEAGLPITVTVDAAANDNGPLPVIDAAAWEGKPLPPRQWYVPKLIPSRTVTLLSGDGGLGKSLVALLLSVASALGAHTMGLQPAPGRVLYVGAEDEADEFHRRVAAIVGHHGATLADLAGRLKIVPLADRDAVLATPDARRQMVRTPLFHQVLDVVSELRPALVVLDTSADLFGGDEINRAQVRQFVSMLRSVALQFDCAVLLLSHPSMTGLQSGSGTSGSTAWNNSVRSRLYLDVPEADRGERVDPNLRRLGHKKSNYGPVEDPILLRWDAGVFVPDDGTVVSPAQALVDAEARRVFVSLLSKLCRQGRYVGAASGATYAPHVMAGEPDAKGFTKAALRKAMGTLLDAGTIKIVEHGSPSRLRKHLVVTAEDFSQN